MVNQIVDRIDNIIYERLRCVQLAIRFLHPVICRGFACLVRNGHEARHCKEHTKTHQRGVTEMLREQGSCHVIHLDRMETSSSIFRIQFGGGGSSCPSTKERDARGMRENQTTPRQDQHLTTRLGLRDTKLALDSTLANESQIA